MEWKQNFPVKIFVYLQIGRSIFWVNSVLYFEMHKKAVTFPIFALGQWDGTKYRASLFLKGYNYKAVKSYLQLW